jgi:hypothetical protein
MVYLALSHFGKRPKFKDLSPPVRTDIKALFRQLPASLHRRRPDADEPGPTELIEERCRQSPIGQQRPNSLWVHVSP